MLHTHAHHMVVPASMSIQHVYNNYRLYIMLVMTITKFLKYMITYAKSYLAN
jgi:hypothetical protein